MSHFDKIFKGQDHSKPKKEQLSPEETTNMINEVHSAGRSALIKRGQNLIYHLDTEADWYVTTALLALKMKKNPELTKRVLQDFLIVDGHLDLRSGDWQKLLLGVRKEYPDIYDKYFRVQQQQYITQLFHEGYNVSDIVFDCQERFVEPDLQFINNYMKQIKQRFQADPLDEMAANEFHNAVRSHKQKREDEDFDQRIKDRFGIFIRASKD